MGRLHRYAWLASGCFAIVAACDAATETTTDASCDATAASVAAILTTGCTASGCHAADAPAVGLDLESADVLARVVERAAATCDRTLVVPGNPALSFLYEKLASSTPECGDRMPLGTPLGDVEIGCIGDWIAALPPGCETCGGSGCADLQADPLNCGGCRVGCPAGATCEQGSCVCGPGEIACGATCVDTSLQPEHCGRCDNACSPMQVCSLGACKAGCDPGLTQCGGSCTNTQVDPHNCGDCGGECGTGACVGGMCDCGAGIDPQTDPDNCGTCGNMCAPGETCEAGACVCGNVSVSLSSIQPIFTEHCATTGCHQPPMAKEGMDLSSGSAHGSLVNVLANQCNDGSLRVLPGDPGQSYLMDKLLGMNLCFGSKMPKMRTLPRGDIEAISTWICSGAPNN